MKSKTKTKEIIIESLKEDTNDESLSLLDEKKHIGFLKNIIFITKYIVAFIKNEERNEKIKT